MDTIGLGDIHSILGRRKNKIAPRLGKKDSGVVSDAVNPHLGTSLSPSKPKPDRSQDSPKVLISPAEYHKKFCIPRRKKRLRQFQRLTNQHGGKQFTVPTFGGKMSRKNSSNSEGRRMIMEDLIVLQQQQLQEQQLQQQQQQQKEIYAQSIGGVGGMGYPYQDLFPSSLTPNSMRPLFGQGANPMNAFGGGNSNFLMPPPFQSGLSRANDITKVRDVGAGQGGSLPQSAFSALDSLAPELRERMLRISKLGESKEDDDGKSDGPADDGDDEKASKGSKKKKKKGKKAEEAASPKSGRKRKKKQKDKPTPTKKGKGKGKRAEEKSSDDGPSNDKRDADVLPDVMARRMTDLTAHSGLSLTSPNHDTIFGHRSSMMDGAAMSLGSSGGIRRDVLGPTTLMPGVSGGFGGGSSTAGQMNMMQLMGINPPPFGAAGLGKDLRPSGQHYSDLSSSIESPNSPRRIVSEGKNEKMSSAIASKEKGNAATLSPAKKSPKKVDVATSPAGSHKKLDKKRKSSALAKTKKSAAKKKKKAKKGSSKKSSKGGALLKPKRPFSAYNLFFQLEREFIMFIRSSGGDAFEDPLIKFALETVEDANKEAEGKEGAEVKVIVDKEKMERELGSGEGINRDFDINEGIPSEDSKDDLPPSISVPPRYKHLKLEDYWYCVARKVKRKHRKTEGSIGFVELTKMVSSRWKIVESTDPKVKAWCQKLADQQLVMYKKDVAEYKEWLSSRPDSDESDEEDDDDDDEEDDAATKVENVQDDRKVPEPSSVPTLPSLPSAPSGLGISPSMGLGISPHAFGRFQQSLVFDRRMADIGRFSDLTDPARMISHGMMMPPRPAPTLPPPPFQPSPSTGDRFSRLGSRSIGMDDTERRFAALAEQESRRRIQTEMSMSSLPSQSFMGSGYGYGSMGMGGSLLGGNSSMGGYPSMTPVMNQAMNQADMSLTNEQMMAQIISLRNNLTHLGRQIPERNFDFGGKQLPQRNFDLGGGSHLPQTNIDFGVGKQLPRQDFDLSGGKQFPPQSYAGKQIGKQLLEQIGFGGKGVENNDEGGN